MRTISLFLFCLFLSACASTAKFNLDRVDKVLTPQLALKAFKDNKGKKVLWGGTIINVKNLTSYSQLEILAYPLGSAHLPERDEKPLGRFLARHTGFLEPTDYQPGRLVTLVGQLHSVQQGKVGEASYAYPLIISDQIHLWPRNAEQTSPRIHFGIGIGISR